MSSANTILVVDDEPDVADLISLRFRPQIRSDRFRFVSAANGIEALKALEQNADIDVVLTDIRMPKMDGLTLLSYLEELDRTLRSIVLTAYGDMENIRTAMNRGAFDFLTKPFDFDDLQITIEKALKAVERQKRADHVRDLFGRYLSSEVRASLLEDRQPLQLGGERRQVTLLMSDLRGFSRLTERLAPEQVVEMLNIYLGRMTEVVEKYDGTIDEFIGDAIFVIFGAPVQRADHAQRAAACAIEMQLAMQEVNRELKESDYPPVEMGIALNTGEVVVGSIGSSRRAKYGVVGSPVNLVSRIESCSVGGQVLISESTLAEVGDAARVGRMYDISVKGFGTPVPVFELEGVGAPYHAELPRRSERLVNLSAPLACRFAVFDGDHLLGGEAVGEIVSLSESRARMRTDEELEPLSDIKLALLAAGSTSQQRELYAKVTDGLPGDGTFSLRFTSLPSEVQEVLQRLQPPGI